MRRLVKVFLTKPQTEKIILDNAKKDGQIVYGQRSANRRFGIMTRPTEDWDIFANKPKGAAMKTEKQLDKAVGFDYFYTKKGMHKGTYKVKGKGFDGKKGTKDDEGIVDYTKVPKPIPKFDVINGIRYRRVAEEIKAKRNALADPNFKFRHEKDRADLNRLRSAVKANRL